MAQMLLIMGESGTGKSTSMRNCSPETTAVVNPVGKPLPFKGHYEMLNSETESRKITKFMKEQAKAGKKLLVVDDFQYILSVPYMNRIKESGWDKWSDFGANYFEIIDVCKELPDDVVVAYMTHTETLDNGVTTIKLIGKMLRDKITIEGLFTTVLRTGVNEGKYYFYTQNSGRDTVKSPMGMFPAYAIDNDLNYVADKMRNFYEVGEYKTDDEMGQADAAVVATEIEKPTTGRKRGGSKNSAKAEEPKTTENGSNDAESGENSTDTTTTATTGGRRSRGSRKTSEKTHDEVVAENQQKVAEYMDACDKAVDEVADGAEEVDFDKACEAMDKVEKPELDKVPRRTRKERTASKAEANDWTTNTDSVTIVLEQDSYFFRPSDGNYLMKHKGDSVDTVVGGVTVLESITKEEFGEGVKKLAQAGNPKTEPINPPVEDDAPTEGTRTRRTRRTR